MPNYAPINATMDSMGRAASVLPQLQQIYQQSQAVQGLITLYQAGTDPTFNNAVNTIFTPAERAQLSAMLTQLNTLVNNWTANHSNLLNGG